MEVGVRRLEVGGWRLDRGPRARGVAFRLSDGLLGSFFMAFCWYVVRSWSRLAICASGSAVEVPLVHAADVIAARRASAGSRFEIAQGDIDRRRPIVPYNAQVAFSKYPIWEEFCERLPATGDRRTIFYRGVRRGRGGR